MYVLRVMGSDNIIYCVYHCLCYFSQVLRTSVETLSSGPLNKQPRIRPPGLATYYAQWSKSSRCILLATEFCVSFNVARPVNYTKSARATLLSPLWQGGEATGSISPNLANTSVFGPLRLVTCHSSYCRCHKGLVHKGAAQSPFQHFLIPKRV